jgi:hypothetical protein
MTLPSLRHLHRPSLTSIAAAAFVVVLLGIAGTASAQSIGKATIDFPFVAGKTQCAAGTYDFAATAGKVTLTPKDTKQSSVIMLVITRLGRHDLDKDPELVFDKVGGKLLLSEVWLGGEDGYLVTNTPGDHEHRILGGSNPHK